jgi:hypothetical protein
MRMNRATAHGRLRVHEQELIPRSARRQTARAYLDGGRDCAWEVLTAAIALGATEREKPARAGRSATRRAAGRERFAAQQLSNALIQYGRFLFRPGPI